MALDKVVDSAALDADITEIANAIRAKGGTSGALSFPNGMKSAVEAIELGASNARRWTYTLASDLTRSDYDLVVVRDDPWLKQNYQNANLCVAVFFTTNTNTANSNYKTLICSFRANRKVFDGEYGMMIYQPYSQTQYKPHTFPQGLTETWDTGSLVVDFSGRLCIYLRDSLRLMSGDYEIIAWLS